MKKGFTLLELLIVMVIIGILAIIAIPKYLDAVQTARESALISTLKECREAGLMYQSFNNADPTDPNSIGIDINGDGDFEKEFVNNGPNITCTGWTAADTCTSTDPKGNAVVITIGDGSIDVFN